MNEEDKRLLSECTVQAFRASGRGGQHVAKTDSAVRLIHLPSGVRVSSQQERSQYLNKKICLERLKKRLAERKQKRKKRVPTGKSKGVRQRERKAKTLHAEKKKQRRKVDNLPE